MKLEIPIATLIVLLLEVTVVQAGNRDMSMVRFAGTKEAQVREFAQTQTNKVPGMVWSFFDAVKVDDWNTATNLAARIEKASGRYGVESKESVSPALQTAIWPPISETIGTYDQFHDWDNKLLHRFGDEIISSIPKGSIYFGGTDPGRFIISALSESHSEGRPFFTLTQNQLVDRAYLDYLRKIYGSRIHIPTDKDLEQCFQDYLQDAQRRSKSGKLKPGEEFRIVDGRAQVSGQTAVMAINALLVKVVTDQNPDREFYIEESFPLEWMYPQLSPHGLILKLNLKPQARLSEEAVRKDSEYWEHLVGELVGDWLKDRTSVKAVCDFADKTYLRKDLDGFKGDKDFARNDEAQKTFSKLRSAIAGVYVWRATNAKEQDDREQMRKAADLAFRQACVLCPYSPEAVYRYSTLLMELKRSDDAILIVKTALRLDPDNSQMRDLLKSLYKSL